MSVSGDGSDERRRALELLRQIVEEHPGLKTRGLKAALKGRKCRVTDPQLEDLLQGREFTMNASGGWSILIEGDVAVPTRALTPRTPDRGLPLPPSGIELSSADLQDVLDVGPETLKDALWVLVANEDGPTFHWSPLSTALRSGHSAVFQPDDLRILREHIKALAAPAAHQHVTQLEKSSPPARDIGIGDASDYGWSTAPGGCALFQSGPPSTFGERRLRDALSALDECLVLLGVTLAGEQHDREVDAVVVTSSGVITIEQKDVPSGGVLLHVPANGPPERDGLEVRHLAHARKQARLHAQRLNSHIREAGCRSHVGSVQGCLSVQGVEKVTGSGSDVWFTSTDEVDELIQSSRRGKSPSVTRVGALAILEAFEIRVPDAGLLDNITWAPHPRIDK